MKCPKCKTDGMMLNPGSKKYYYCSSCNYAFSINPEYNKKEFTMEFNGLTSTQGIVDFVEKTSDLNPVNRSIVETQMTAALFEQWFDGFKAGQLASIVYAKEYYDNGKDRNESGGATEEPEDGATSGEREAKEDSREDSKVRNGDESIGEVLRGEAGPNQKGTGKFGVPRDVESMVNGVSVKYPFDVERDEDELLMEIARIIETCSVEIKSIRVCNDSITLRLK